MKEGKEAEANEYRLIDPEDTSVFMSAQAYTDNVVSVARESTYHFYEKVVDETYRLLFTTSCFYAQNEVFLTQTFTGRLDSADNFIADKK